MKIALLLIIFFSINAHSKEGEFKLKNFSPKRVFTFFSDLKPFPQTNTNKFNLTLAGGMNFSHFNSEIDEDMNGGGPSLSTEVVYRWNQIALGVASNINAGIVENTVQKAEGSTIYGKFWYRGIAFGPVIKYHHTYHTYKGWHPFLIFSPLVEIYTATPRGTVNIVGGTYNKKHPIKYEGYGGMAGIGITKSVSKFADMIFYQVTLKVVKITKLYVMSEKIRETEILSSERLNYDVYSQVVSFNVGLTLF